MSVASSVNQTTSQVNPISAQFSLTVEQWWDRFGSNFVAHAVWNTNVQKVLKNRSVKSAEQVLREQGSVEFEVGSTYGVRGVKALPKLDADDVAKLNRLEEEISKDSGANDNKIFGAGFEEKMVIWDFYVHMKLMYSSFSKNQEYQKGLSAVAKKHISNELCVAIAYDMSKPPEKRVDARISKIYQDFLKKMEHDRKFEQEFKDIHSEADIAKIKEKYGKDIRCYGIKIKDLHDDCLNLRRAAIPVSKLNCEIRTLTNKTAWSYGDVVVYKKREESIVGSEPCGETCLLEPWQNNGQFFELSLDGEDVLILAPRAVIEEYNKANPNKYKNLHAFEDLSPAMLDKFNVPKELQPKHVS